MKRKGVCRISYEVAVAYSGLTVDELHALLKLYEVGRINSDKLLDPVIAKDYETDCDGYSEPSGTWNVSFPIDQCGGISKDSWKKWYESGVIKAYEEAEEIRELIKHETGIE